MKENKTKTIDGQDFTFFQLNPFKANRLLIKLVKIAGPALGSLANSKDVNGVQDLMDADIDAKGLLDSICEKLDEDEIEEMFKKLLSQVHCSEVGELSNESHCDTVFKGKISLMYKVVFAALEAQFGDFFGANGVFAGLKVQGSKQGK
ncbi:MAG: hypothetical protein KAR42_15330 [candidate division Zixibacteria bacterium]|nr:hypothetical protein [candidate division Zixibacteria bacterium]